jgi:hypothetical protein
VVVLQEMVVLALSYVFILYHVQELQPTMGNLEWRVSMALQGPAEYLAKPIILEASLFR